MKLVPASVITRRSWRVFDLRGSLYNLLNCILRDGKLSGPKRTVHFFATVAVDCAFSTKSNLHFVYNELRLTAHCTPYKKTAVTNVTAATIANNLNQPTKGEEKIAMTFFVIVEDPPWRIIRPINY